MKAIVAVDKEWGIGKDNGLLFRLPADMAFFKENTLNTVVVMGRKTLQSFPNSKPLKNRVNIVLSNTVSEIDDAVVVKDVESLLKELEKHDLPVFVIGGASIYKLLLSYCTEILVTKVNAIGGADTFFPNLDQDKNFVLANTSEVVSTNGYNITFNKYKRV